jgi:hypothetical protein
MSCLRTPILATALALATAPAYAEEGKELKVAASAKETSREYRIGPVSFTNSSIVLIRSAEELVAASDKPASAKDPAVQKEMTAALAKVLKVEAIDWKKQMVVAGIAESVDSLKVAGNVLTVNYTRHYERPVRAVLPKPKVVVLAERFEGGEVKFVPKASKDEPKN